MGIGIKRDRRERGRGVMMCFYAASNIKADSLLDQIVWRFGSIGGRVLSILLFSNC